MFEIGLWDLLRQLSIIKTVMLIIIGPSTAWDRWVLGFLNGMGRLKTFRRNVIVTNWHFSRSFRLIFFNTYDRYSSRSGLINLNTFISNHFAYSLRSQITRKRVY